MAGTENGNAQARLLVIGRRLVRRPNKKDRVVTPLLVVDGLEDGRDIGARLEVEAHGKRKHGLRGDLLKRQKPLWKKAPHFV